MHRNGTFRTGIAAAVVLMLAAPALAGGIDDFKLTRAIPADAFMAVHSRGHDGQAFVNEQFERVWKALENSRLDRDLRRLFKKMAEQEHATGGEEGGENAADEGEFDRDELVHELEQEMLQAAEELDFERAAALRDHIGELKASPNLKVSAADARPASGARRGGKTPRKNQGQRSRPRSRR